MAGKTYLIVNLDAGKALGTTQNGNNRAAEDVVIDGDAIHTIDNTVCELTLGSEGDNWTFFDTNYGDNGGYLYAASSTKNYLRTQTTNDANGEWSITIASDGAATLTAQGTNTHNLLKYNSASILFSCYTGGQQAVCLFVREDPIELTEGWNWWTPTKTMTLSELETALDGKGVIINSQDAGFARYENHAWSGTLNTIEPGKMYKIETTAPVSLTMTGTPATSTSITILPGYNWIGYTGATATPIATALGSSFTVVNGDKITAQDGTTITYNNGWSGSLTLTPGHGYVYYSAATQSRTLSF